MVVVAVRITMVVVDGVILMIMVVVMMIAIMMVVAAVVVVIAVVMMTMIVCVYEGVPTSPDIPRQLFWIEYGSTTAKARSITRCFFSHGPTYTTHVAAPQPRCCFYMYFLHLWAARRQW